MIMNMHWEIRKRRRLEIIASRFLLTMSVILICSAHIAVLGHKGLLQEIFTGGNIVERLKTEEVAPREVLVGLSEALLACINGNEDTQIVSGLPTSDQFDRHYGALVDFGSFSHSSYNRGKRLKSPENTRLEDLVACAYRIVLDRSANTGNGGVLSTPERLDSRIHWTYILLSNRGRDAFAIWPSTDLPSGFNPRSRPWSFDIIEGRAGVWDDFFHSEVGKEIASHTTIPYPDAVTRDHIVSIVLDVTEILRDIDDSPILGQVVVDVRIGKEDVYDRLLLLNLLISTFFYLISLSRGKDDSRWFRYWSRAWLTMAVLYSFQVIFEFADLSQFVREAWLDNGAAVTILISMINSFLLLQTAVSIPVNSTGRTAFDSSLESVASRRTAALFVLLAGAMMFADNDSFFPVYLPEAVEALYSALAMGALGASLSNLVIWSSKVDSPRQRWLRYWAVTGIGFLFFGQALLQLTVPFWPLSPLVEEFFWLFSIPAKVAYFLVFYMVLLYSLYWRRARVNELFAASLQKGLIVVDKELEILNTNVIAAKAIGLPASFLEGKDLRQVLFGSLSEAERIWGDILQGKRLESKTIEGKYFRSGELNLDDIKYQSRKIDIYPVPSEFGGISQAVVVVERDDSTPESTGSSS